MDVEPKRIKSRTPYEFFETPLLGFVIAPMLFILPGVVCAPSAIAQDRGGLESVVEAVEPRWFPNALPTKTTNASIKYANKQSIPQSREGSEPERITPRMDSAADKQNSVPPLTESGRDTKAAVTPGTTKKDADKKKPQSYIPVQRPIGQISINVRPKPKGSSNTVPENLAQQSMGESPMVFAASAHEMMFEPTAATALNRSHEFGYQPLYFEEVNLERYGRTHGHIQPALSGLRFFATIPSLPYAMTVHDPNKTYTWHWPYEAGWGAPKVRELEPLQWKPGMVQAAAVTGLIFVVP